MCNSGQLGDEFHFCLECPALKELRNKFLPANISKRSNIINFRRIFNIKNTITLVNVAKFIKCGLYICTDYKKKIVTFICYLFGTLYCTYGLEKYIFCILFVDPEHRYSNESERANEDIHDQFEKKHLVAMLFFYKLI